LQRHDCLLESSAATFLLRGVPSTFPVELNDAEAQGEQRTKNSSRNRDRHAELFAPGGARPQTVEILKTI